MIQGEGADFSARWGWVQILDFALGLRNVELELARGDDAHFEFTESNQFLKFSLHHDEVVISSSYAAGLIKLPADAFRSELRAFVGRVIDDLCEQHPALLVNPELGLQQ